MEFLTIQVKLLRVELKERGYPIKGSREELVERLKNMWPQGNF